MQQSGITTVLILWNAAKKGAEQMAQITYTRNGDYLIPDIQLTPMTTEPLGKYGRMRRAFLREEKPILFNELLLTEKLFPHLREVQETASRRVDQIMSDLLKMNPAPDKMSDQMGWVRHMNSLKAQAEEIVTEELINN
jgi:hypothetical protein